MAIIFKDGFDKYGVGFTTFQTATMPSPHATKMNKVLTNEWTINNAGGSVDNIVYIGPPLSATGQSLGIIPSTSTSAPWGIKKIFGSNYARSIGGVRFQITTTTATTSAAEIRLIEGSTVQCRIGISNLGEIFVLNNAGTVVASYPGVVAVGATHHLTWNILCANAGTWQVWLDGISLGSGTGADFQGGANAYYQTVQLDTVPYVAGTSCGVAFDDFYMDDGTGAVITTNPIVDTEFVTGDSSIQFTNSAYAVGYWNTNSVTDYAPGVGPGFTNVMYLRKITPAVNVTLNNVNVIPDTTYAPAKFKGLLYADSAGAPAGLTATGTEVVGTTANTVLSLPFASGQALTGGTSYWIGFMCDVSVNFAVETGTTTVGWEKANTYASGAPNPAGTATSTTKASMTMWGGCSGISVNWRNEANLAPLGTWGDTNYITDSVVGHEDLYDAHALNTVPNTIYSVAVKAYLKDSAAGARTVTLRTKSGATDDPGSNTGFTPATTYGWGASYWLVDPNTSAAWDPTDLDAAKLGVKITA